MVSPLVESSWGKVFLGQGYSKTKIKMRISFDLDDTLVLHGNVSYNDTDGKLLSGEVLRKGSVSLLKELVQDHELWIYTTSFRKPWVLKFSFWLKGIKINRVINETAHRQMLRTYCPDFQPSKYPKHFGIDVHIDDSKGVQKEGEIFGFNVIQVDPDDINWTETIISKLRSI